MAERLEIAFELTNLVGILGDLNEIISTLGRVNRAAASGGSGVGGGVTGNFAQIGAEVALAAAAFALLAKAVDESVKAVRGFTAQQILGGGTARETALGRGIAAAAGLGNFQQIGADLRAQISGGGLARLAASRLGIGPVPQVGLGNVDTNKLFDDIIEGLRRLPREQQRILTEQLGHPELQLALQFTKEQNAQLKTMADYTARAFGQETQDAARNFAFRMAEVAQALQIAEGWAVRFGRSWLSQFPGGEAVGNLLFGPRGGSVDKQADALEKSASATERLQVSIDGLHRTIIGGGPRAQAAFPAGLRGDTLRKAWEGSTMSLGAFKM